MLLTKRDILEWEKSQKGIESGSLVLEDIEPLNLILI